MSEKEANQSLETIFSKGENIHKKGIMFYLFIFFICFLSGVGGAFVLLVYGFPYLESQGIDLLPVKNSSEEKVKVIEKIEDRTYIESSQIIDVIDEVSPSVVSVISKTYYRGFFGQVFSKEGGGTGFIIESDGKVLTNKHVVSDINSEYKVITKSGDEYNVANISLDPFSDIAVLTLADSDNNKPSDLPVVSIGSSHNLKAGQRVVAIGNALGKYDNSVTTGVISATGRKVLASDNRGMAEELKGLIQTDAAINPGNSGGPLLNLNGEVIGINTAVANGQNIGFAIPIDDVISVVRSIKEFGEIKKPYLGVSYRILDSRIAKLLNLPFDEGALLISDEDTNIMAIDPNGPAAEVGLKEGDIIVQVDNEKVTEENTLMDILRKYIPNEQITLRVYRPAQALSEILEEEKTVEVTDYIDIVVTLKEMVI